MKLSLKITLLLICVITLFIILISAYFSSRLQKNFTRQAENELAQSVALMEERIEMLKGNLETEIERLASSLFTENETTLAAMLSRPPVFNADAIGFANKLQRRTTLDFLYVISADHFILSSSLEPATFGKADPYPDLPTAKPSFANMRAAALQLTRRVDFGQDHTLLVRGGYFLNEKLPKGSFGGVQFRMEDASNGLSLPPQAPEKPSLRRVINLQDENGQEVMRLTVFSSLAELQRQKSELFRNSAIFIAIALAGCVLLGYLLSLSISRPVARLHDAAIQMSEGNLDVRVTDSTSGELAALTEAFNRMAEQLEEKQKKLLQTERIAAWQEIAQHLAHEIKNPLTPIRTSLANLRLCLQKAPEKFPEIFSESGESILQEVEKLRKLADEFARFARLPAPSLKEGDLNEIIAKSVQLYCDSAQQNDSDFIYTLLPRAGNESQQVSLEFHAGNLPRFYFDPEQATEVIHNLLQNAIDAIESEGRIRIDTSVVDSQDRNWVLFVVEDNGKGMNEEVRRQIFTPYFTTKPKGTGLGLAIVQRIVTEHGGSVILESQPGKGSRFEIRFPI